MRPHSATSTWARPRQIESTKAGAVPAYRFAVGGHKLQVVHTDGYAVQPTEVDTLIIGMGERYDVIITAGDGAFPILARPEGKRDRTAMAVLRSSSGATPTPEAKELSGKLLTYAQLSPTPAARLATTQVDRKIMVDLTMKNGGRQWLINGEAYPHHEPLDVKAGETVGVDYVNHTMMFHPMHLHGHTFALVQGPATGPAYARTP